MVNRRRIIAGVNVIDIDRLHNSVGLIIRLHKASAMAQLRGTHPQALVRVDPERVHPAQPGIAHQQSGCPVWYDHTNLLSVTVTIIYVDLRINGSAASAGSQRGRLGIVGKQVRRRVIVQGIIQVLGFNAGSRSAAPHW